MKTIACVFKVLDSGEVVVFNGDNRAWCGDRDGWVGLDSSYFDLTPDCWAVEFKSLRAAVRFAREEGLL